MSQANRVETMAEKLAVYATRAGVGDVGLVSDAYHIAMPARLRGLHDVFHYDVLHPARTALILIEDADIRDARVLAAALLTETLQPELRADSAEIAALGSDVAGMVAAVPDPAVVPEELLLEALVTAERNVAMIAVAERLDHARHLHMREPGTWRAYFETSVAAYLPVATRLSEELARRFERWAFAFERRFS